jgi:hypothetical protein
MLHGAPWRVTKGAAPDAVKAACPVLNGEDEETGRKVLRLVLTQQRGGSDQTGHLCLKTMMLQSPPVGRFVLIPLSMIGMPLPAPKVLKANVHKRIVVLHYSPIRDTVVEESPARFVSRFKPAHGTIASLCCDCRLAWLMPTTRRQKARRQGRVILQCRGAAAPQDVSRLPFCLREIPGTPS